MAAYWPGKGQKWRLDRAARQGRKKEKGPVAAALFREEGEGIQIWRSQARKGAGDGVGGFGVRLPDPRRAIYAYMSTSRANNRFTLNICMLHKISAVRLVRCPVRLCSAVHKSAGGCAGAPDRVVSMAY